MQTRNDNMAIATGATARMCDGACAISLTLLLTSP